MYGECSGNPLSSLWLLCYIDVKSPVMLLPSPRILSFATTLFIVASILWLSGCGSRDRGNKPSQSWTTSFRRIGTLSSPAWTDLNGDGVLDVVLGAGSVEFHPSDSGVLALDGDDG